MIHEVKKYTDDDGRSITAYIPLISSEEPVSIRYEGNIGIKTPMGIMPINFDFPQDYPLSRCFEEFEKTADLEIKRMQEEIEDQNRIITPDQMGNTIKFKKPL